MTETVAPRAWRRVAALSACAALVAGAAFAIGRFSAFDASEVPRAPGTMSAEAGFARDMQVHHAQAVDMAMTIYAKTDNDSLSLLAYDMATSQQAQIGIMSEWLIDWNLPALGAPTMAWMSDGAGHGSHSNTVNPPPGMTAVQAAQEAMGMASVADLERLDAASGQAADCLFLELMVTHHHGAVEMVDAVLERASNDRVLSLAEQMAAAQSVEITAMESLQADLRCS